MRLSLPGRWACTLLAAALASIPARLADTDLPARAQAVFKTNCYRCHGQDGTAKGGFGYVLDRDQLVARGKVVPGKADESELFLRVRKGEMPPAGQKPRPGAADLALLRRWIDAGAPAVTSTATVARPLTPAEVHDLIRADLKNVDPRQQRFLRYLSLTHLANAGRPDEELEACRQAVAKLLNALSWHPKHRRCRVAIDPGKTILRIDLRDYQWNARSWERLALVYPYRFSDRPVPDTPVVLRADWFVATASRPPLYHDLLLLPSTDRELERQLRTDVPANIQEETVARAGFNDSGVSGTTACSSATTPLTAPTGAATTSATTSRRQNLFDHPLGPTAGRTRSSHAGGEIIFSLPNGLHGYLLVDRNGRRDRPGAGRNRQRSEAARPRGRDRPVVHVVPRPRHPPQGRPGPRSRRQEPAGVQQGRRRDHSSTLPARGPHAGPHGRGRRAATSPP